ncbi:hypothetical protein [Trichothermofontia sp.]
MTRDHPVSRAGNRAAPPQTHRLQSAPTPRRQLPSASLGFLVLAYCVLGWSIADFGEPYWLWWLLAIGLGLSLSAFLSLPLAYWRSAFMWRWLQSEIISFISVFVGAFSVVLLLTWIHVLMVVLLLLSAMALARLDLLTARFTPWQSCLILAVASQTGLVSGWILHWLMLI